MSTRNKKRKRKRKGSINRTLDFSSETASSLAAAAGLPYSNTIASNATTNELFVQPNDGLSTGLMIRYAENAAAAPAQRSNSARTTSSSLSELDAIHKGPASYEKYLDNKKKNTVTNTTKGTNTYAEIDDQGDVIMGGRKTRRKKRRRKRRRKTRRKKRKRKRKTKKRRK